MACCVCPGYSYVGGLGACFSFSRDGGLWRAQMMTMGGDAWFAPTRDENLLCMCFCDSSRRVRVVLCVYVCVCVPTDVRPFLCSLAGGGGRARSLGPPRAGVGPIYL